MSAFTPAAVQVVDLDGDPAVDAGRGPDGPYREAHVVVRRDGRPVGALRLRGGPRWSAEQVRAAASGLGEAGAGDGSEGSVDAPAGRVEVGEAMDVVVATRDRPEALRRALRSILGAGTDVPLRSVIVVDNAPEPGDGRTVVGDLAAEGEPVRYLHEPRPGLSRAHNAGVRAGDAPIVVVTDDDVVVDRQWLRAIAEAFADDRVGAVTGLVLPIALDTPTQQWAEDSLGLAKGWERRAFDLDANRPDDPLFPFTAGTLGTGANMAFRRRALESVGGFDDDLGAGTPARGGDDLAAFHDVVAAGWTLVYEPAAIVHHDHHRDPAAAQRTAYGYGVALSAYLTRLAWRRGQAGAMARRLPGGLRRAATTSPATDVAVGPGLARRHRLGMAVGPFAYAASVRASRRIGPTGEGREEAAPVPILLYHGVGDCPEGPLADYVLPVAEFDEHLAVLEQDGWDVWTVADLVDHVHRRYRSVPERTAVLTFDDGFAEMADVVAPRLAARGWAATLYVTTGAVGGDSDWLGDGPGARRPMLDWDGVVELDRAGWELGAHSVSHPELDVLGAERARWEIERSRDELADHLGHEVRSFAYPHGYHSAATRDLVVAAGFESACAVREARSWAGDDPFALARLTVRSGTGGAGLRALLGGAVPLASARSGRLGRSAWRAARRVRHHAGRAA